MKNLRWPIALIVVAVLALSLPLVAGADNQWGKYSWPDEPKLSLGDNLSPNWDVFLITANDDWNESDVINNKVAVNANRASSTDCIPATGLVEICNDTYGDNGWLGIAGIWIAKGKQITKGYVKLNDTYFNTTYNTSAWRQMVMCQEVGHIFGLGHQDENFSNANLGTCMDYTNNPGSNQHPNQHDYDQLSEIYGSGGGGDSGPEKGNNGKGNNGKNGQSPGQETSEWGKAISTDGNGRPDMFELDLGGGNKLITHVLWAN